MICNICADNKETHTFEKLNVCNNCQKLINKELEKPIIKDD